MSLPAAKYLRHILEEVDYLVEQQTQISQAWHHCSLGQGV